MLEERKRIFFSCFFFSGYSHQHSLSNILYSSCSRNKVYWFHHQVASLGSFSSLRTSPILLLLRYPLELCTSLLRGPSSSSSKLLALASLFSFLCYLDSKSYTSYSYLLGISSVFHSTFISPKPFQHPLYEISTPEIPWFQFSRCSSCSCTILDLKITFTYVSSKEGGYRSKILRCFVSFQIPGLLSRRFSGKPIRYPRRLTNNSQSTEVQRLT